MVKIKIWIKFLILKRKNLKKLKMLLKISKKNSKKLGLNIQKKFKEIKKVMNNN